MQVRQKPNPVKSWKRDNQENLKKDNQENLIVLTGGPVLTGVTVQILLLIVIIL